MTLQDFFKGRTIAFIIILATLGIIIGFNWVNTKIYNEKQGFASADQRNAEYVIAGERIRLVNGIAQKEAAPGSASMIVTKYFGNEVYKDLNADGREDVVFLLTQETGGSGVFYYVAAALNTERGYMGSEAMILGDRIAPQSSNHLKDNTFVINYADRAPGESFATPPSVAKSMWVLFDPKFMQFGEVVQNFEGESNLPR